MACLKRIECTNCKAHILGGRPFCSVCGKPSFDHQLNQALTLKPLTTIVFGLFLSAVLMAAWFMISFMRHERSGLCAGG